MRVYRWCNCERKCPVVRVRTARLWIGADCCEDASSNKRRQRDGHRVSPFVAFQPLLDASLCWGALAFPGKRGDP